MEKRFIILTDLSEQSEHLIKYANEWSVQTHASLLLVHETSAVTPAFTDDEQKEQIAKRVNNEALQQLKAWASQVIPERDDLSFKVSEKSLPSTLNEITEEASYEHLIFMGLKKTGLWEKVFLGSKTMQIIENTSNIVVALPQDMPPRVFNKVYVAVPEQNPLHILQFNGLLKFIDQTQTEIVFFYISKPYEETKDMKKQLKGLTDLFADRFDVSYEVYEGNDPFQDIKKVINDKTDEILVIQKGSRLLTDYIFRKFLVNELVYEGLTPLIILP